MSFGSTSSCLCWKALSGNWIAKNVFIIFAALSSSRWILNPNSSRFKREAATSNTVKNSWQCFHWILSSGKFMRKIFESISFNYSTTGKTWKLSSASENLFAVLKNKKNRSRLNRKRKIFSPWKLVWKQSANNQKSSSEGEWNGEKKFQGLLKAFKFSVMQLCIHSWVVWIFPRDKNDKNKYFHISSE